MGEADRLFDPGANRAGYVRGMFGEIAARYDLMNTLMTGGRHHAWRRLTAHALVRPGDRVLDVGCGTGDLAFACLRAGASSVLGVDFARPMLTQARRKARAAGLGPVAFAAADATRLPVADASVDVWCSGFVVRNIPDLDAALAEAWRVLRPGGRLGILEIPRLGPSVLRPFARAYFQRVVPLVGRLVSGHASAYRYLPVSVDHFLAPSELAARLRAAGFEVREVRSLMFGTVALHLAQRPEVTEKPWAPAAR
jgi:demethylmenaquinone methyltransferase/2-methoxy-6-polyprenyl-1,4-benzoquinol methylase